MHSSVPGAIVEMRKNREARKESMKSMITPSGEDYLEDILVLQKQLGMVRSVDVARHMAVSKPSVCHAVATLRDGGFLRVDEDHFLHLTDAGREVAEAIYERHCFFTEQLIRAGVDPQVAEADACRMEHAISSESFRKLKKAANKIVVNDEFSLSREIIDERKKSQYENKLKKIRDQGIDSEKYITKL